MPEYLAPGVYVEEVDTGAKPIEGVSTSTTGFVGITERGPLDVPILITSQGEFRRWFGGFLHPARFAPHQMLPHAVDGFFNNLGKRLYVVRVLPGDASDASLTLYGGRAADEEDTILVRSSAAGTGDAVNPPPIYVLDSGDIDEGDFIRIGDGDQVEYRSVDAPIPADPIHVALARRLTHAHPAGTAVGELSSNDYTLDGVHAAGSLQLNVDEDPATAQGLIAAGLTPFVQVVDPDDGSLVHLPITGTTTNVGPPHQIDLGEPLPGEIADDDTVSVFDTSVQSAVLTVAGAPGDRIVYIDDRQGDFATAGNLIFIAGANPEAVVIGRLARIALTRAAYETYPAQTPFEPVAPVAVTADAAVDADIDVSDVSPFAVGGIVEISDGAVAETTALAEIENIAGSTLTFVENTPFLVARLGGNKALAGDVAAGASQIALDNRVGLEEGAWIQIGEGDEREYVRILQVRGTRAANPDAGSLLVETALAGDHAEGDLVRRVWFPEIAEAAADAARLLVPMHGTTGTFVDGMVDYADDSLVRFINSAGEAFVHVVEGDVNAEAPARELTLDEALTNNHGVGSVVGSREALMEVRALDPGAWGDRLRVFSEDQVPSLLGNVMITDSPANDQLTLATSSGVEAGTILEILDADGETPIGGPVKVGSVGSAPDYILTLDDDLDADQLAALAAVVPGAALHVRSREFKLTVEYLRQPDPAMPSRNSQVIAGETFEYLSMDPRHSRYVGAIIGEVDNDLRLSDRRPEGQSWFIRIDDSANNEAELHAIRLGPEPIETADEEPARLALSGGDDAMALTTANTVIGTDHDEPESRTGLYALRNIEEISIVAAPGQNSLDVQGALIRHCELMRYRFAVLDGPSPPGDTLADVRNHRQQFDTKYAALYHPWLTIRHPYPRNTQEIPDYAIPPAGHMCGIYARTDVQRGVHKSPANEIVSGIVGLRRQLNKAEHDMLNPSPVNINVIRDFRPNNRGIRIFGGRCITSDTDWKYVNVRRLVIFIEHSIDRGLQWVVFEPNAEPLWARVRRSVSNFLITVWRNGALEGVTPEQGFYVKCDRTTMTQTDIDNGRLICEIGIAPVKPAEFVIVRIGLWTASAED